LQPKLLSHQDTHTYRLSNLLKISAAPFRLIRQQQRSEIMKHSLHLVKLFRKVFSNKPKLLDPSTPPEIPVAAEEVRII